MRYIKNATFVLIFCAITLVADAQEDECDCAHFHWEPEPPCFEICRNRVVAALESQSYMYTADGEVPRANIMASDAAEVIYGQGFPETEYAFPVLSSTLYNDPEALGWTDVSAVTSKVGAIAVWPTMSGLVVEENSIDPVAGETDVLVLYPSHARGGELTIGNANQLGEGAQPKFLVPTSALSEALLDQVESESAE